MAVAKKWDEVVSSEQFKSLSPRDQFLAKKEYWETVSKPSIEGYNRTATRDMGFVNPDDVKRDFFGGRLIEDISPEEFMVPNVALDTIGGTVATISKSAGTVAEGVIQPVLHPIQTAKGLGKVVSGVIQKMLPGEQINEKYVDAIGEFYKDRYGSVDAIADTVATDPVGFLFDVATVATGTGAGLKGIGTITKNKAISTAGTAPTFTRIAKEGYGATGKAISGAGKSIVSGATTRILGDPATRIYKNFEKAFPKSGKTITDLRNRKDTIVSSVKAMSENIPEEGLVNPLTEEIITSVPKNRYETLIAAHNAKNKIWEKATALSKGATEAGAEIDIAPIIESAIKKTAMDYGEVASRTTKHSILKKMLDEGRAIAKVGKITPTKAQEFMKTLYNDSKALEKSGVSIDYSMKDFYKNLYEGLRSSTDEVIESTLKKSGYNHYRGQYAALKKTEDAIKSGANAYLKSSGGGLQGSLANFWSIEELLSGNVAKAITVKGASEVIKYLRNPDRSVVEIFNQAKKITTKKTVVPEEVLQSIKMLGQ